MSDAAVERFFNEAVPDSVDPMARLAELGAAMRREPETFDPAVSHYRAAGLYGRRIYVPAGQCVLTEIHKFEHLTVALAGECLVSDGAGNELKVEAPAVFITPAGTQRAVYAITNVEWLTVHAVESLPDVSEARAVLTCRTAEEYRQWDEGLWLGGAV